MTRARELAKLANPEVFSVDASNNVGVNSSTPDAKLDVVGVVSATQYFGDGSNLTGIVAGATLNASSGTQRLVVTSQTSGSMTQAATNADISYNTSTNTLSATNFSGTLLGNATGLQGTPSITVQDVAAEKVSIAGTISYEDVTNVNSVGIITANKGIKVPNYGMTVTGVVTATSYQGDGSSLTGVESGVSNFVASGAIGNGDTVIIKTDGTATVVAQTGSANPSVGSAVIFNDGVTNGTAVAYDSNAGKIVIAFRDNGDASKGKAIVGTVDASNNSISFGSEVQFHGGTTEIYDAVFDSNSNKVVIIFQNIDDGGSGKAVVGTVSGTSISFGSVVEFRSGTCIYGSGAFDSNSNKVVIAYRHYNDSNKGKAIVGTVSGTSISFGSEVTFNNAETNTTATAFDSNSNKIVISYKDGGNSNYGTAIVGTVSGTSISFGSESVFSTNASQDATCTFDSTNNKIVIAYRDSTNSSYGTAVVGTVSGTSISFGTPVVYESASSTNQSSVYDSNNNKIVITYRDDGNSGSGTAITGTVSGTSISFGTPITLSADNDYISSAFDSTTNKVVIAIRNGGGSNKGTSYVLGTDSLSTNLTTENYIGLAAEAISNGATGKITTVGGINSGQTGLTTAQTYYVQNNGSLATSAGNPSVVAGTAVSNTKVLVWKS